MRPVHATRTTSWAALVAVLVLPFGAGGCGDDNGFGNEPRPPEEITVSATIAPQRVSTSPSRFGGGPIELLVSNQTRTSQRVTLQSLGEATGGGKGRALKQSTGPINPGDTASLKANLAPGSYSVSVGDDEIEAARFEVGPPRASAKDRLLQP
jgi:hypothetical protein